MIESDTIVPAIYIIELLTKDTIGANMGIGLPLNSRQHLLPSVRCKSLSYERNFDPIIGLPKDKKRGKAIPRSADRSDKAKLNQKDLEKIL